MAYRDPEALKAYQKQWAEKNREKLKVQRAARFIANRDKRYAYARVWNRNNADRISRQVRERRSKNLAKHREWTKTSYWRNVEKRRVDSRKYSWAKSRRRLARLRSVVIDERGIKEWMASVKAKETAICYYCASTILTADIEFDHVIPISRQGPHTLYNLAVSCMGCNRSKHAKTPAEWPESGQRLLNL